MLNAKEPELCIRDSGYSILLGRASNADQNLLSDAQQILDTLAG